MTVQVVSSNGQEKYPGDVFINWQQCYSKNSSVKNGVWAAVMLDQKEKIA